MGYSIILSDSRKEIQEKDVQALIDGMPKDLRGFLNSSRQPWGWTAATDLSLDKFSSDKFQALQVSGSYSVSGSAAMPMAQWWKDALEKIGYEIEIDTEDFDI